MKKPNEQTIQFVSGMMKVECHHYDLFDEPRYKDIDELKNAICVIYSSPTGTWKMAINQDGTIVLPTDLMSPRRMVEKILQNGSLGS